MKRTASLLLLCILVITDGSHLSAQDETAMATRRKVGYDAFVSGKLDRWTAIMAEMECLESPSQAETFELIRYYYGYSAYLIGIKEKKKARTYVDKGDKIINQILKAEPGNATALAFKGSFTGLKVTLNKWRIITLGPESIRYINRAYKADPEDLQAITDKANLLYFTPGMFGGDKTEALAFFEKAIRKIENNRDTEDSWFYLALLSLLAEHYEKQGHHEKAVATQQKLLRIEPGLKWIKEKILSKLDEEED